jgi:hypothetical protein
VFSPEVKMDALQVGIITSEDSDGTESQQLPLTRKIDLSHSGVMFARRGCELSGRQMGRLH